MKFTRVMRLQKTEIINMIQNGFVEFEANQSWSGENVEQAFNVDEMYGEYEVFFIYNSNSNLKEFYKFKNDLEKELDEYRNFKEMKLMIDNDFSFYNNIEEILESFDEGFIEFEMIRKGD